MTSKRKSHRIKKSINYADSNSNHESDDDFEEEFEPQSKKAKTKEVVKKDRKTERNSPTPRLSLDEKLYQRDIEKALQISLSKPTLNENEKNDVVEIPKPKDLPDQDDSDYEPDKKSEVCDSDDNDDDDKGDEESESDFSEEEVIKKTVSKGKKAKNKKTIGDSKESVTGNKKQSCVVNRTKKPLPTETSTAHMKATIASRKPDNSGKVQPSAPKMGSPTVSQSLRSFGLGGVVIKNPGPPIRVGLSRNMKVKPLHSKVSVSH